jgi:hypothetical protein
LAGGEGGCSNVIAGSEGGRLNDGRQRVMVERCLGLYALAVVSTTALAWRIYLHQNRTEMKRPLFMRQDRYMDLLN